MPDALRTAEEAFGPAPLPTAEEAFGPDPRIEEERRHQRLVNTGSANPSPIQDFLFSNQGPVGTAWHSAGRILDAFGQGFEDSAGFHTRLIEGSSKEEEEKLKKWVGYDAWSQQSQDIARAANRALLRPAAYNLELAKRLLSGTMAGTIGASAQTAEELGAPPKLAREVGGYVEYRLSGGENIHVSSPRLPDIQRARELGVIGPDGEAGWRGTAKPAEEPPRPAEAPLPEAATAPAEEPVTAPAKELPPVIAPPAAPPPVPADIHVAARQIDPQTFEQYDALTTRRDTFRRWIDELRETRDKAYEAEAPNTQEIDRLQARIDDPDTTPRLRKKYEERLVPLREERDAYMAERPATDSADMAKIRERLQQVDYQMRDLAPQVSSAYRAADERFPQLRPAEEPVPIEEAPVPAAEAPPTGTEPPAAPAAKETVAPPPAKPTTAATQERLPLPPGGRPPEELSPAAAAERPAEQPAAAPVPLQGEAPAPKAAEPAPIPKPRTIEEQRAFIQNDVARQLIRAGRPKEEAEAAGALIAARYETRAALFKGARGTAEDLYRSEGAEILGPGMRAQQPVVQRPSAPRPVNEEKLSLVPFLARRGGISPSDPLAADLRSILGDNSRIFREGGMTLDRAREAAAEAGYIANEGRGGTENRGGGTSTVRDLLDAISQESRGRKVYRPGMEPRREAVEGREPTPEELEEAAGPLESEAESELMTEEDRQAAGLELLQPVGQKLKPSDVPGVMVPDEAVNIGATKYEMPIKSSDGKEVGHIAFEIRTPPGGKSAIQVRGVGIHGGEQGKGYGVAIYKELADYALSTGQELWSDRSLSPSAFEIYRALERRGYKVEEQDPNAAPFQAKFKVTGRNHNIAFSNSLAGVKGGEIERGSEYQHTDGRVFNYDVHYDADGNATIARITMWEEPEYERDAHGNLKFEEGDVNEEHPILKPDSVKRSGNYPVQRLINASELEKVKAGIAEQERQVLEEREQGLYQRELMTDEDREAAGLELLQREARAQTETPEFKRWFGDSKVVDESGEPLVVYHGTGDLVTEFDLDHPNRHDSGWLGTGVYMTTSPRLAGDYALMKHDPWNEQVGPNIMPLFARLENPYYATDADKLRLTLIQHNEGKMAARDAADAWTKELKAKGHDGVILDYPDKTHVLNGTKEVVVFDPAAVKSATGNRGTFNPNNPSILEQPARGKINLNPTGEPGRDFIGVPDVKPIIRMMRDANASTIIHEYGGHAFLAELLRDAEHPAAPDQLKADAQTTLKWLGVERADLEIGAGATKQQTAKAVTAHEKFATGFEQYLREGTAPSAALARVFAQFRQWLLNIYQTIKGLGQPINEDIRGVFDRLLAEEPQRTVIAPEREAPKSLGEQRLAEAEAGAPESAAGRAETNEQEISSIAATNLLPDEQNDLIGRENSASPSANRAPSPEHPETPSGGAGPEAPAGEGGGAAGTGTAVAGGREESPEGASAPAKPGKAAGIVKTEPPAGPHEDFEAASPLVDKAGNFRLENITDDEDVRQAIRDSVNLNHEFIDERRGVVSDEEAARLADASGLKVKDLDRRAIGDAWNKEQIFALEKLFIQAATDVKFAAEAAARAGTEEALFAYGEAEARQRMILDKVASHAAGVRAEAGRALQAYAALKKMKGGLEARAVADVMMQSTGTTLFQLKQRAQAIAGLQTPAQVAGAIVEMNKPGFGAMALEIFKNWLISGPITHTTYHIGSQMLALYKAVPETAFQALASQIREGITGETGTRIYYGEVGAQLHAMFFGQRDGWRAAWDSFKTGQTMTLPEEALDFMTKREREKYDELRQFDPNMTHDQAITRLGIGGASTPFTNTNAVPGIAGTIVRIPGERMVAPLHSFGRTVGYIQSIARQAYRQAANEGLTGNAFRVRMAELKERPTQEMMTLARNEATEQMLMGHGGEFTKRISAFINWEANLPRPIGPTKPLAFVDPFIHIASNIMKQAVVERSPVGLISSDLRSDIAGKNGPLAQDTAIARMAVGTSLSVMAGGLAMEGLITPSAPSDRNEAAMTEMVNGTPHSLHVGNLSIELNRLGVLGMQMGIAADLYHIADHAGKDEMTELASLLVHSFTQNFMDEGFLKGPSDMIKALDDPDRYGGKYVRNFVSSFAVPYSVGMSQMARQIDPYSRQARTTIDAMKAKVPWLSETLMPRRDIWGEPILNREYWGVYVERLNSDPVNKALKELGVFPSPVKRQIRGVDLTDEQYDEYAKIAGRLAKMQVNAFVSAPGFKTLPAGIRVEQINKLITAARESAATRIMMQNPEILKQAMDDKVEKLRGEPVH